MNLGHEINDVNKDINIHLNKILDNKCLFLYMYLGYLVNNMEDEIISLKEYISPPPDVSQIIQGQ